MSEKHDNKVENQMLEDILNTRSLSREILKISDTIMSQNISTGDKKLLHELILGPGITNEDEEIHEFIDKTRLEDIKGYLLYSLLFKTIEEVFDVDDREALMYMLSVDKEEIEVDINYFYKEIIDDIHIEIKKEFGRRESLYETILPDYMSDHELETMEKELHKFFEGVWKNISNSKKINGFKQEVQNTVIKKRKFMGNC